MAEIREFPGNKEGKNHNFTAKILKHRLGTAIRILVAVALIVVVVIILRNQYRDQRYTNIVVAESAPKESLAENSYIASAGNVVTYSKDGISSANGSGKVLWNMTYEMQKPMVRENDGMVAVCDYNGHLIYVINSSGKESEIDTNLPIRDFALSAEGRVAAIVEDAGNSWVNIYDSTGEKLVEIKATMTKTGYPMAVALSGEVMAVSYMYVDAENIRSSVTFYNFGGIGENTADHIVSSYDYSDAVVPIIDFLNKENVYAVSDNRLMFYAGEKKPVSTSDVMLSERIVGVIPGDIDVALIFYDISGEHKYRLYHYGENGKLTYSYAFDMDYKDIVLRGGQTMIYNENQCLIVGSDGQEKFNGFFEHQVIFVAPTDSNHKYVAVTRDAIETLKIE